MGIENTTKLIKSEKLNQNQYEIDFDSTEKLLEVLKNSKIAYSGIYSDSESDDFKESDDHKTESAKAENLNEVELVTNGQKAIIEKYYVGNNLTKLLTTQKIKNIDSLTMLQANEIIKKINAAVKKAGVKNEQ
jgi:hypothetical protein